MPNRIPLTAQEKQAESEVCLRGSYSMLEFQMSKHRREVHNLSAINL